MAKDWNKVFEDYKGCKFDAIKEYIDAEAPDYKPTVKEAIENKVSFLKIKRNFYDKFFPQFVPVSSKKTMKNAVKDW